MRAVWSLWRLPCRSGSGSRWGHEKYDCLSWLLSVGVARRHFSSLALHADDDGARLLIDELGLAFDHLSLSLNSLHNADSEWWMQGKLLTYSQQQEPFVHIDSDVYLFNPLPARITSAPVLANVVT